MLTSVAEMNKLVKQQMADLSNMLMQTRWITDDNLNLIKNCRDELSNLLTQQINYLEDGFKDLIRRLEEKKQYFTQNFDATFKTED